MRLPCVLLFYSGRVGLRLQSQGFRGLRVSGLRGLRV